VCVAQRPNMDNSLLSLENSTSHKTAHESQ